MWVQELTLEITSFQVSPEACTRRGAGGIRAGT
jgi:hypothetical protein